MDTRRSSPEEARAIHITANVVTHCHSSVCVELGSTRVICIVRPPQQLVQEYRGSRGRVSCQVHRSPTGAEAVTTGAAGRAGDSSGEKDLALALEGVAEQAVVLESIPQLLVETVVEIVRDDGGLLDAASTALSVALAVGGFEMYGLFSACSAGLLDDGSVVTDMTSAEESRAVATAMACVSLGDGSLYFMLQRGLCDVPTVSNLIQTAVNGTLARKEKILQQVKSLY